MDDEQAARFVRNGRPTWFSAKIGLIHLGLTPEEADAECSKHIERQRELERQRDEGYGR